MHLFEKTIDSEVKYEGKILTVCSDKAELENGAIVSRDVIRHNGGVGVVPITDEGDVLFVRQFRYPFQKVLMEIPAGKLNAGEDHAEAGRRELQEGNRLYLQGVQIHGIYDPYSCLLSGDNTYVPCYRS